MPHKKGMVIQMQISTYIFFNFFNFYLIPADQRLLFVMVHLPVLFKSDWIMQTLDTAWEDVQTKHVIEQQMPEQRTLPSSSFSVFRGRIAVVPMATESNWAAVARGKSRPTKTSGCGFSLLWPCTTSSPGRGHGCTSGWIPFRLYSSVSFLLPMLIMRPGSARNIRGCVQ